MAALDITAVLALLNKAVDADSEDRSARAAELFERAAVAAEALQQPDCAMVAFLRIRRAMSLMRFFHATVGQPAVGQRALTAFFELLPAVLATVQRRAASDTLLSTCRSHEAALYLAYMQRFHNTDEEGRVVTLTHEQARLLFGYELQVEAAQLSGQRVFRILSRGVEWDADALARDCDYVATVLDTMAQRRTLATMWGACETNFVRAAV